MQHVLELHKPQGTPARARVGELTILVSTFLTSPCFRAVCRCAQGEECKVGDDGYNRLRKFFKNKAKLKEQFASELVWFPVVVTVRGDLTTHDEPGDSFSRVTYLDRYGDVPTENKLGWLTDKASLVAETTREVSVACDEQYSTDGKVQLNLSRPRRDVHHDAALERTGHRWTPQNAVSFVFFLFIVDCAAGVCLTRPPPFHPPCRAPFADVQRGGL